MNIPSVHLLPIIKSLHTSGSLLCWWGPSPTQDVWACSSPPLLLLHWSLAPSLNEAPSPRPRVHAVHGPRSPFSQSHGMISSTAYLGVAKANAIFNYEAPFNRSKISLTGALTSCLHSLCVLRCASDLWWCQWGPGHESSSAAWPEPARRHSS